MKEKKKECEKYSPGYSKKLIQSYQRRKVNREAIFFTPHLHSKMNLLDCGCGPGTITVGLAKIVSEGKVTGIDIEVTQIEKAKKHALDQNISNIQFQVANIYELPFSDNSFDAVFSHALMQHLKHPLNALKEIKRVLKPRGVVGLRDDDQGSLILSPHNSSMNKVIELIKKSMKHYGGNPKVGRQHRELLRKAGFINVEASSSCEYDGILEETQKRGDLAAELITYMTETAVKMNWATIDEMKKLSVDCKNWGRNPDAFDSIIWCEAVGWKE
ncbi:MAG: class I SAM-dependent methyltransferase [Bacteroidetes bacterium]|nr:class I SAM-dependent methyltransferase [Bacteroidota bacterium]